MTNVMTTDQPRWAVSGDLASLHLFQLSGPNVTVSAARLRTSCKCAHCLRARFDHRFPENFPGIAIVAVTDLGYGVNIAFSDGHARGVYPWTMVFSLREDAAAV